MRKSKKRVIAIITCCIVIATLCVGVFADDDIDPNDTRLGTILTTTPYDIGELRYNFDNGYQMVESGYYIMKITYDSNVSNTYITYTVNNGTVYVVYNHSDDNTNYDMYVRYNINSYDNYSVTRLDEFNTYYVYVKFDSSIEQYQCEVSGSYDSSKISVQLYSISDRSVIDSVYFNSQDVNSSIVNVINEATNVITTNDVVMMFCILIPVISFGVGILIRLRKRA